ncbi:MAG: ABC transporter substrate-binding protein [Chloroflexota bacterium]
MERFLISRRVSRRSLIALGGLGVTSLALNACMRRDTAAPPAASNQQAPAATAAPKPAAAAPAAGAPQPTAAPAAAAAPAKPVEVPKTAAGAPKRGGTITVAMQNDILTFDNALNSAATNPHYLIYDPLFFYERNDKGEWEIRPGLIEKWEMTPTSGNFQLRQGVKFHDGSDWNADVLKWNFERWINDPKSIAKGVIDGVDLKNPVTVVDPYTVKVNLSTPTASLLQQLNDARVYPMSKAYFDKVGADQYGLEPVGTGPFKFSEWKKADRAVLKRNESYWMKGADGQPLPYLDSVVYRLIIDDSVRMLELKAGTVDYTELIGGKDVAQVKADPNLVFYEGDWVGNTYRLIFNAEGGKFFENPKLRHAALYAIDREAIAKALGQGIGRADKYFPSPGSLAYDESLPYHWYDPEKAKALVKEAGFANGVDVELLIIARQNDKLQGEMLKSMFDAVGIRTTVEAMERVALNQRLLTGGAAFDFTTTRGDNGAGDPDIDFRAHFWSKGRFAKARLKDKEVDDAIVAASSTYDVAERKKRYQVLQKLLYDKAVYGYLWTQRWNWLSTKRLQNVPPPMASAWDFRSAFVSS